MTDSSPPPRRPRRRGLVQRQEIYTAPPAPAESAAPTDDVTVSTLARQPRVYLTAPPTVPQINWSAFMGRWYEIARLPYFTQRRCVDNVYADYRLDTDGTIYVTNTCRHRDGRWSQAKGLARMVSPAEPARLQISFRMLYGVYVFWDDYWIIGLGAAYEYALIGDPTRQRGWMLARQPCPAAELVQQWCDEFANKGLPAAELVFTRHTDCSE